MSINFRTKNVQMASINDRDKFLSNFTKIEYILPNLIISYSEIRKPGSWSSFVKPGDYVVKIPFAKSAIEVEHYNGAGDDFVCIKCSDGIWQTFEGQNELIEDFYFYSTKLNIDKVYCDLCHLQRLIISEGFIGNNDTIIVISDTTQVRSFSISVLEEEIYSDNSFKGMWGNDVLSLIKKNSGDKLNIALYATRNGNHVPVQVKVPNAIDTTFVMELRPMEEISSLSSIKGNCAPLVASSSNPDYITEVKRWLFRKNEYLSGSLLNNMIGITRELNRTSYNDFITKDDIPVLKSFSGTQYTVASYMKADYYILYACSSQQEINDFVEEIVSNDFELTTTSHLFQNRVPSLACPSASTLICVVLELL